MEKYYRGDYTSVMHRRFKNDVCSVGSSRDNGFTLQAHVGEVQSKNILRKYWIAYMRKTLGGVSCGNLL